MSNIEIKKTLTFFADKVIVPAVVAVVELVVEVVDLLGL